jgi:alpha-amylase
MPFFSARPHLRVLLTVAALSTAAMPARAAAPVSARTALNTPDTRPVSALHRPSPLAEGWQHGAFMEIFVRAYADSDGDGIGDLKGLTQHLDYLQALGIKGLWLMPLTRNADGDHGYATTDFRSIAPEYGTLADFDDLITQAHRRGIGVVMDYVINHSAAQHPWFQHAVTHPDSPWRSWYVFEPDEPTGWDIWGKNPWYLSSAQLWNSPLEPKDLPAAPPGSHDFYFGTFGPHMPDFNLRNTAVVQYHEDSLRFWLNRGLDGFRLDAVPHMIENSAHDWNDQPESRALTQRLHHLITGYDKRWTVCEATASPTVYADPALCGSAFAFGYTQHFVKAALGETDSIQALADYWRSAPAGMSTMVSNHDIFAGQRLWDQVQGNEARYKVVAASYLLQPGTPFIYYGEEIGQAGVQGLPGDLPLRSPMSWTADAHNAGFSTAAPFRPLAPHLARYNAAAQARDPASLLAFYRDMLALRNAHPSLSRGSFGPSFVQGQVLGFVRSSGPERTLVLINYGAQAARALLPDLGPTTPLQALYPHTAAPAQDGAVALPAQSLRVYRLAP